MRKGTGVILLVIILALGAITAVYFLKPQLLEKKQRETSDARERLETIRIAGDNYLGYWFLSSAEMRKQAPRNGLKIIFTDDGGAYADRLRKFADEQYDAIVLPVNSYLNHGQAHNYPGVIVAAISESKGADGIVAFSDNLPTGKVNDLNNASLRFVYTGESPSEFLIDLTIFGFGLSQLEGSRHWGEPVDSSRAVYERAKNQNGDVFVLWEPDLSKALELPGIKYVWGSDKFGGYIIDVFVFHRDFLSKKEAVVRNFFKTYYRVMALYRNNADQMREDMERVSGIKNASEIVKKIKWFDLRENLTLQFGIARDVGDQVQEGLADTIIACTDVMINAGKFQSDPLQGDPYKIINSSIVEELGKNIQVLSLGKSGPVTFEPLSEADWGRLREVGSLRIQPIKFQIGRDRLDTVGKLVVDDIAMMLQKNYAQYRVVVRGHTGPGDEAENIRLSERRAQVVVQYLKGVHSIDPNRLRAEGAGSKYKDEVPQTGGRRAWLQRLARVEFILKEANPL